MKHPALFGNKKKKYLARTWEPNREGKLRPAPEMLAKGNEIARRDNAPYVRNSLKRALQALIFGGCKSDDPNEVRASAFTDSLVHCLESARVDINRLVRNEVGIKEFSLSKTLKTLESYCQGGNVLHPHVQIALRDDRAAFKWKRWMVFKHKKDEMVYDGNGAPIERTPTDAGFSEVRNVALRDALCSNKLTFTAAELAAMNASSIDNLAVYIDAGPDKGGNATYYTPDPANWPTNNRVAFFYRQPRLTELKANRTLVDSMKTSQLAVSPEAAQRGVRPWRAKALESFKNALFRPLGDAFSAGRLEVAHALFDAGFAIIDRELRQQMTLFACLGDSDGKTILDVSVQDTMLAMESHQRLKQQQKQQQQQQAAEGAGSGAGSGAASAAGPSSSSSGVDAAFLPLPPRPKRPAVFKGASRAKKKR